MEKRSLRRSDFKLGTVHGKTTTERQTDENELRNQIFFVSNLRVETSKGEFWKIRLLGYEVPLEEGNLENPAGRRVQCIDLLGYDSDFNPVVIELKDERTTENIDHIVSQVDRYAEMFNEVKWYIEKEVRDVFFWADFSFKGETKKVVLVGREFWKKQSIEAIHPDEVKCCSFSRIAGHRKPTGEISILDQRKGEGFVTLKIENKRRINRTKRSSGIEGR